MTSFYVDHGAHEEITSVLFASHRDMGTILEGLNARLNSMPEAVKGQAVPLWPNTRRNGTPTTAPCTRIWGPERMQPRTSATSSSRATGMAPAS